MVWRVLTRRARGLGGFAGIVDDVGGVEMCLDETMNDARRASICRRATRNSGFGLVVHQSQFVGVPIEKITTRTNAGWPFGG